MRSGDLDKSSPNIGKLQAERPDDFAARLRGFGPVGILAILIVLGGNFIFTPLSALFALLWAWLSKTSWREIGFVRPNNWIRILIVGIIFGSAFKLLMK